MAPRISNAQIDEAKRLLALGKSHRETALRVGISRASIDMISRGKLASVPRAERVNDGKNFSRVLHPYRCKSCGGMVITKPCVLCHNQAVRAQAGVA